MKKIRLGVVGLNNWYHAYPFTDVASKSSDVELVVIADEEAEHAKWGAEKYGAKRWTTDLESVVNDPDIDAIVLTVYTTRHAEMGIKAAKKGKHILCDKPIEATFEKSIEFAKAVKENNIKLHMSFPRRFSPQYIKAKELIQSGAIGEPIAIVETGRWPLPRVKPTDTSIGWYADPKKAGVGAFGDHAVHQVDSYRWLLEDEVEEVQGKMANLVYKDFEVEDYGIAILKFKRGVVATVESSWTTNLPGQVLNELFIQGSKGDITISRKAPQLTLHYKNDIVDGGIQLDINEGPIIEVVAGHNIRYNQYRGVFESFIKSVLEDKPTAANEDDGVAAVEIFEAAYLSDKEKRVVKLPLLKR